MALMAQDDAIVLGEDQVALEATFRRWRELGVTVVRLNAYWGLIETRPEFVGQPLGPDGSALAKYEWGTIDKAVERVRKAGFKVWLTLSGGAWKRDSTPAEPKPTIAECRNSSSTRDSRGCLGPTGIAPASAEELFQYATEYADFVHSAVRHYADRATSSVLSVRRFAIWNEPNGRAFLRRGPKRGDGARVAEAYYRLYKTAWDAAQLLKTKTCNQCARIYLGELSEGNRGKTSVRDFLNRVVPDAGTVGAAEFRTHGVAFHPYQHQRYPHRIRKGPRTESGGISNADLLSQQLDTLWRADRLRTPSLKRPALHFSEYGVFNRKPYDSATRRSYHTEKTRANWYAAALKRARQSRAASMLLYQATEKAPRDAEGSQTDCDVWTPPIRALYQQPEWDMGLFGENGEVTGNRCYGKGRKGGNEPLNHPQPRAAYCRIWHWAARQRQDGRRLFATRPPGC